MYVFIRSIPPLRLKIVNLLFCKSRNSSRKFEKYVSPIYTYMRVFYFTIKTVLHCLWCIYLLTFWSPPSTTAYSGTRQINALSCKWLQNTTLPSRWNFPSESLNVWLLYHILQRIWSKTVSITFGEIILRREYSCLFKNIYRTFHNVLRDYKNLLQENRRTRIYETCADIRNMSKFFPPQ